jgi:small neutral amino acid transporter SnatA (MarC family)
LKGERQLISDAGLAVVPLAFPLLKGAHVPDLVVALRNGRMKLG